MTRAKQVEDADFTWPEPLVIDILCERYPDILDWPERLTLARLQAHALRESYAGRVRQAAAARLDLIAFCAARGIGPERIARVDRAVVQELAHLATTRFRTSPRTSGAILHQLEAALQRLDAEPQRREPAPPAQAFHAGNLGLAAAVTG